MRVGRHEIDVSNREKVFFPESGITKGDLVDYYRDVAETMLPHVRGRPLTLQRFPDGIAEEGFYQKETPASFPDWIERVTVEKEDGHVTHVTCEDAASLVYLADQGCITPHAWLARKDRLHHPDLLILDLDPPDGRDFDAVRFAAREARGLFMEIGLEPYLQTTGSRGVHVVTPLDRSAAFDAARSFAQTAADLLAQRHPEQLTTEIRKDKRRGRVFLDTLRNAYAQSFAPPYAVRPKPGAPVATPIDWDELGRVEAQSYTLRNLFRRLAQKDDPWRGMARHRRSLEEPRRRLEQLSG